ncbi:TonB-dependent receptor [Flavihumibacter sp. R14]|nr:TonB-dependent receptor [Flavihumibacter soli]
MKLITLFWVAAILQVSASSFAQKIALSQRNAPLNKIFNEIQVQSGYDFLFTTSALKDAKLVSISVKDAELRDVLTQIFKDQPLDYTIEDKSVVILKKNPAVVSKSVDQFTPPVTITGKITDDKGVTLPGVSVKVKGSSNAVASDTNGAFTLTVADENVTLVFSFIGFSTQEIVVSGRSNITVVMKEEIGSLNEVVVVGYGTQKKANVTGAVNTVEVDKVLGNRPVTTTGSLLQGTVPGLNITIGSGEPGVAATLNIRGATDINSSGGSGIRTQGPFIVVDNVPFNGPLNLIDPNDIESITVLKDAGSAAIYGARSAFGVVLVTTKKGAKNQQTRFNYSNNLTIASPMNLPEKASVLQTIQSYKDMGSVNYFTGQNVDTWLKEVNEYNANPSKYPQGFTTVGGINYPLAETDAIRNVLGDNSHQFLHNFSVNGGSEKTTYRISAGTVRDNGIIVPDSKQDYYKRYNLRSVVSTDIKEWFTAQLDASYYNSNKSYPANDGFGPAAVFAPYIPMDDSVVVNGEKVINGTPRNIVALRSPTTNRLDDTRLSGRAIFKPLAGLRVTGEYTYDNLRGITTVYDKAVTSADARTRQVETLGAGLFRKTNEVTDYRSLNLFANYEKAFSRHNLSVLTGYNQEENSFELQRSERNGVISADFPSISQATGAPVVLDNYSEFAVMGLFGRINYDFDGKYLLGLTGRYDASSNFPENHRTGFFPSVSAGWSVTKEKFMDGVGNWLNEFKPRASFGTVGNQAISPYAFLATMDASYANWLNDNKQVTTLSAPGLISSDFTWATVQTLNIGLDLGLLNNRFTANLDWFRRDTKDMLYEGIQLPAALGTIAPLQNVAELRSNGMEVQLNWQDKIGKVSYRFGANVSDFRSKITKIKNEAGILSQYYVGQELGEIWGYTTNRLYTVDDFVAGTLSANLTGGTLKPGIVKKEGQLPNPGDVMFVDYDGNGIINEGAKTLTNPGDKRVIGNSTPRYRFGVNGGLTWKGLDFSFVVTGAAKQDQWRANGLTFPNYYAFGTIYSDQLDYWTPTNPNAFWGRTYDQAGGNQPANQDLQSRFLLNGAHLRVRNLTLGYTLPASLSKKLYAERFQAFISVENAFVFDHMPNGLDSDITRAGVQGYEYPFMRQASMGVNLSF